MKIRPVKSVKADLFHADRRTEDTEKDRRKEGQADMTNLIDVFRNSAKAPKRETETERERESS